MSFKQKISDDMKDAMKSKDQARLDTLRLIKAALMNKEVATGVHKELTEAEEVSVLQSLVKQRKDSIDQYTKGGRADLAEKEAAELRIAEKYLPATVPDGEIAAAIEAAMAETGAAGAKDMGKVMKAVKEKLAGRTVDGGALSAKVKARLGG
ncbi:MAG: GatB/YqeY domain-containing protein [Planctomycetes bacterium]|nr:GatB/YqeY domain-containing protein [Planctomycetota bacterium]